MPAKVFEVLRQIVAAMVEIAKESGMYEQTTTLRPTRLMTSMPFAIERL